MDWTRYYCNLNTLISFDLRSSAVLFVLCLFTELQGSIVCSISSAKLNRCQSDCFWRLSKLLAPNFQSKLSFEEIRSISSSLPDLKLLNLNFTQ